MGSWSVGIRFARWCLADEEDEIRWSKKEASVVSGETTEIREGCWFPTRGSYV